MSQQLDFIFDFGSPNAYFASKVLPDLLEQTGATLHIVPCLLGGIFKSTENQPPMMAFSSIPAKLDYMRLEMNRFIKKHQLNRFQFNPNFPVNTILLMRGALVAEQDGRLADYVEAGLMHMWEQGLKMDDPEVFANAMTEAGFDGPNILERTQDPAIKTRLIENTQAAVDRGVFGIPTFFVGTEMFFGKDRMAEIEDQLREST